MPVDLKNMPDVSVRPASPRFARWIVVLMILIGFNVVISRLVSGKNNTWLPVNAEKPEHLWLSGVDAETETYATLLQVIDEAGLKSIDPLTGFHNFNDFLGDPGNAALWLAVAGATQTIRQQPAHHLLICREHENGKVWNMVVSPVTTTKEGEV